MTKEKTQAMLEAELRNPQVDFTNHPNLAVQTGNKTISQIIEEFDRAGRAIMVAEADANFPETPGLRLYPDPLETWLLENEVDAELQIARKRLLEDQENANKKAEENLTKAQKEAKRLRERLAELENKQEPKTEAQ